MAVTLEDVGKKASPHNHPFIRWVASPQWFTDRNECPKCNKLFGPYNPRTFHHHVQSCTGAPEGRPSAPATDAIVGGGHAMSAGDSMGNTATVTAPNHSPHSALLSGPSLPTQRWTYHGTVAPDATAGPSHSDHASMGVGESRANAGGSWMERPADGSAGAMRSHHPVDKSRNPLRQRSASAGGRYPRIRKSYPSGLTTASGPAAGSVIAAAMSARNAPASMVAVSKGGGGGRFVDPATGSYLGTTRSYGTISGHGGGVPTQANYVTPGSLGPQSPGSRRGPAARPYPPGEGLQDSHSSPLGTLAVVGGGASLSAGARGVGGSTSQGRGAATVTVRAVGDVNTCSGDPCNVGPLGHLFKRCDFCGVALHISALAPHVANCTARPTASSSPFSLRHSAGAADLGRGRDGALRGTTMGTLSPQAARSRSGGFPQVSAARRLPFLNSVRPPTFAAQPRGGPLPEGAAVGDFCHACGAAMPPEARDCPGCATARLAEEGE
eukprot:TRINITY_DN2392_c0_g1_i1.p1 TRINITY_DN2392_c0_g1~~TRINITY_DN2392_c0_g1_i1.p1  ORF type:complete len:577 (-),score=61.30 TRINITY_DN2392_c0_g1_i1:451-1938(-)